MCLLMRKDNIFSLHFSPSRRHPTFSPKLAAFLHLPPLTGEAAARLACSPAPACIGLSVHAAPPSSSDHVVSVAGGSPGCGPPRRRRVAGHQDAAGRRPPSHPFASRSRGGQQRRGLHPGRLLRRARREQAHGDPDALAQLQVLLQLVLLAMFPAPFPRLLPAMTRSSLLG
jgi:hypothetical protein